MPRRSFRTMIAAASALALTFAAVGPAFSWGHTGHRFIGYLAVEGLPEELPLFLRASATEVGELAREQDRSKGSGRIHDTDRDSAHFIDLDDAGRSMGGPHINSLPETRQAYEAALQGVRSHSWEAGYLPYSTIAAWQQLRTNFAYYRVLQAALARPQPPERRAWYEADLRRREQLILSDLGTLAHYVGDGSQPLHVSIHYNGWGDHPNPRNYTRSRIHAPFEGEFVSRNVTLDGVRAAMVPYRDCSCPIERRVADFIRTSWTFVEPLYQLWGQGAFADAGTEPGRAFATTRVAAGASELRDLIVDAWRASETHKVGWPSIGVAEINGGADPWNSLRGGD